MTEKTINCADCEVKYTYTPNPNYPDKRKYCANCSEKKKAEWAETTNEEDKPEVEKIQKHGPTEAYLAGKKAGNGFHLTPEKIEQNLRQVKAWALASAIEWAHKTDKAVDLMPLAKSFEQYILTGE